ncbi:MAG: hypothetical protein L0027_13110, partial [Candidatus Rokubacteria bacterium]|nr:hypothetical protein [Candidatus Rokubacteria bacterium]
MAWAVFAAAGCGPSLPPLPEPNTTGFAAPVREQIEGSLAEARERPRDPATVGRLGMMLHAYEEFRGAAQAYRRARALEPAEFRWAYYLGLALASVGDDEAALTELEGALAVRADYAPLRVKLGDLLLARDDPGAAEAQY